MDDTENRLFELFINSNEVRRIKEIEPIIDSSEIIKENFTALKDVQKRMVNSKYYGLENQYCKDKKEYDCLKEKLISYPFMEEYFELLESVYDMIDSCARLIEKEINEKL